MSTTPPLRTDENGLVPIAIVGSRSFLERDVVEAYVRDVLPKNARVISGGAPGPDTWAADQAKLMGYPVTIFPIDYANLPAVGRAFEVTRRAYQRNKAIAQECEYLVAFWNPLLPSGAPNPRGGTRHVVKQAKELGKPCLVILPKGIDPRQHRI